MKKRFLCVISLSFIVALVYAQEKPQNNFEDWSAKPPKVVAGEQDRAPSDAIILFSDHLELWSTVSGKDVTWATSADGFAVVPGTESIITKQDFGSCQLHIEWRVPSDEDHGESLNWGNSGIKFMGYYEVQIYDSYDDIHKIYYNGQTGSIYKQHKPLVNCSKKPGEWERYDIVFTAPNFNEDGSVESPAYFTVFQNGILIQNHVEVRGRTSHTKYTEYVKHPEKLPLYIQSHGSAVEYRNIWIREL